MAQQIILPRQGQSVETCLILNWRKQEGEEVREGDVLVEVETDKAAFEVPCSRFFVRRARMFRSSPPWRSSVSREKIFQD
jgi:hypothetical protein